MLNQIVTKWHIKCAWIATLSVVVLVASAALANTPQSTDPADLTLKGNQQGTVFRSLTVEGENRVQVRFERPELSLDIDPSQAPGLVLDDGLDILDRTLPDLVTPFLQTATVATSPFAPRVWLDDFATGPVARFTPVLDQVATWKLQVVDSRGTTAMVFAGQGNPPPEIAWDGLRLDGTPAPPGYTYSYVLTARDDAGNQRRFVGDGFGLPAYRRDEGAGPEFLFSGEQLAESHDRQARSSSLLLEAAGWFNVRCAPTRPLRVVVTHRTEVEAARLAGQIVAALRPLVGGSTNRIIAETRVESGAPAAGTIYLTVRPQDGPVGGNS